MFIRNRRNILQIYIKFPNYTQTDKNFARINRRILHICNYYPKDYSYEDLRFRRAQR